MTLRNWILMDKKGGGGNLGKIARLSFAALISAALTVPAFAADAVLIGGGGGGGASGAPVNGVAGALGSSGAWGDGAGGNGGSASGSDGQGGAAGTTDTANVGSGGTVGAINAGAAGGNGGPATHTGIDGDEYDTITIAGGGGGGGGKGYDGGGTGDANGFNGGQGGNATYTISSGTTTAGSITIAGGNEGTDGMDDGIFTGGTGGAGGNASLELSGGTLSLGGQITLVDNDAAATFSMTGGTLHINSDFTDGDDIFVQTNGTDGTITLDASSGKTLAFTVADGVTAKLNTAFDADTIAGTVNIGGGTGNGGTLVLTETILQTVTAGGTIDIQSGRFVIGEDASITVAGHATNPAGEISVAEGAVLGVEYAMGTGTLTLGTAANGGKLTLVSDSTNGNGGAFAVYDGTDATNILVNTSKTADAVIVGGASNAAVFTAFDATTLQMTGDAIQTGDVTVAGKFVLGDGTGTGGNYTIGAGSKLSTGMWDDGGGWTSNLTTDTDSDVVFETGSTWYVLADNGYKGGKVEGDIEISDDASATAALVAGNKQQAWFNFSLDGSGTTYNLNGAVKDDINVSNAVKNIAGMVDLGKFQNITQSRANFFNANFDNSYRGQCEDSCKKSVLSGQNAWVNYVGRYTELEATNTLQAGHKNKLSSNGVQLGMDLYRDRCNIFGVLFGYEALKSEILQDRVKGNDYYFGFYGARMMGGGFDLRGSLGYGHQTYKMDRFDDGTLLPVVGMYRSSFSGNTFESSIDIGRRYYLNRCFSYRPMLGLDFYNNHVGGASEENGLIFNNSSLTQTFLRVGSDAQWKGRCFDLNGGLYYAHQMAANGNVLRTGVSNGTVGSWANGANLGNSVITFNAGAQYYLNASKSWSLFGNYYGDIFCDRDGSPLGHTVFAGMNYKF